MTWTPPLDAAALAHVAALIAKDGAAHIEVSEGCEPVTSWRIPPRVDELRCRLGASLAFDEKTLTWIAVVPPAGPGPEEVIRSASATGLCEALDAAITRRAGRTGHGTGNALAVLAQFWDGIYVVGRDGEECWCQRAGGTGEIMRAMSPEQLNTIMSAAYRAGLDYPPQAQRRRDEEAVPGRDAPRAGGSREPAGDRRTQAVRQQDETETRSGAYLPAGTPGSGRGADRAPGPDGQGQGFRAVHRH